MAIRPISAMNKDIISWWPELCQLFSTFSFACCR